MAPRHVEATLERRHTARMETARAAIVVVGAGPAGAAAALGLARLGYEVAVVDAPAARPRRESFSERVVAALRSAGLEAALEAVEPRGARVVRWAGEEREVAGEAQVERAAFDAALAADLSAHGVRVVRGEAKRVAADGAGARVELASGETLAAAFAIDARGRAAPSGGPRERGPETTCIVQRWRARETRSARTAVISLENGWAWLADDGRGALTTQLALDADDAPARSGLRAELERALRSDPLAQEWLGDAAPEGDPTARAATAVLSSGFAGVRMLRAGDAALAVDPLSGNGVFQALSTALVAPAVVNTLLRRPERAALARSFYAERARDVFLRFARLTREFYARGAAHHGGGFWHARAAWPAEPAATSGAAPAIELRPVVCDGWIEEREVVITPERPLGTWLLAGVELAPIVRAAARGPEGAARALAGLPTTARDPVRSWLRAHGEPIGSDPNGSLETGSDEGGHFRRRSGPR
jgi:flavin-dependent dehydrogenase